MKYYPRQTGRIVQWAGGQRTQGSSYHIHGFNFLQLEVLDLKAVYPSVGSPNSKIPKGVTFGSISRPEKIADVSYNNFIFSLLKERPELNYLYTGRKQDIHVVPDTVRSMPNAVHIGWVEPEIAIEQYAIYLEPFPWGGGEMSFLALKTGLSYLTLSTKENSECGIFDILKLVADSGPAILQHSFCRTKDELRSKLLQLADDLPLRQTRGDAWRSHIQSWRPTGTGPWVDFHMN
jgi:hypothetical protein